MCFSPVKQAKVPMHRECRSKTGKVWRFPTCNGERPGMWVLITVDNGPEIGCKNWRSGLNLIKTCQKSSQACQKSKISRDEQRFLWLLPLLPSIVKVLEVLVLVAVVVLVVDEVTVLLVVLRIYGSECLGSSWITDSHYSSLLRLYNHIVNNHPG